MERSFFVEKEPTAQAPAAEEQIQQLTELLIDKLFQAVGELDVYTAVSKIRQKEGLYNEHGKSVGEIVTEKEHRRRYRGIIDRGALKQLTAALKDLKDIQLSLTGGEGGEATGVVEIASILEELEGGTAHV